MPAASLTGDLGVRLAGRRVLIYSDSHLRCGVGRFNLAFAEALLVAGVRTGLFQRRESHPALEDLRRRGLDLLIPDGDPEARAEAYISDRSLPAQVSDHVRPDLVYFSNGHPLMNTAAIAVARDRAIPYVICEGVVHDDLFDQVSFPDDRIAEHYAAARRVVCMSRDNRSVIEKRFEPAGGILEVIRPSAREEFFQPRDAHARAATRARLHRDLDIGEDAALCLTVGKFDRVKGADIVMAVADVCAGMAAPADFLWVGEGEGDRTPVPAAIGPVRRLPLTENIWDMMDAADMFLLPSRREGMPRVLLEAMAKGLPVMATKVGGNEEALDACGVILPSPEGVAAATRTAAVDAAMQFVHDPVTARRLGDAARTRAAALFRPEREIRDHLAVLDKALL